ncbi:MAG: carboxypeptidase regulatory-like domain-containing protein [Sandaracinaceae bacterium]|nr:carboxypeptidase regulatory-like domain-containing protein [Sandaracinaceae bacterium]
MGRTTRLGLAVGIGAGVLALAGLAAYGAADAEARRGARALGGPSPSDGPSASDDLELRAPPPAPGTAPPLVEQARCAPVAAPAERAVPREDRAAREAAQRALGFLARDTLAWQQSHQCYGCHVQAVTLEAMVVGRRHNYDVADHDLRGVLRGLLDIPGGARGPNGFSVGGSPGHLIETSQSFGGAALAEYDEHVGRDLGPGAENVERELVQAAEALLAFQNDDGSVRSTDHRPPVVAGTMQSTTQAARTWRQAHARTADDRWLAPIARAEGYIRTRARQLTDGAAASPLQDVSYAIIGLLAAGASSGDETVEQLARELSSRQGTDGGFALIEGREPDAFATGQALYVLKRLGRSDDDPQARRATGWLIEHQAADGGWGSGGTGRAMAMWAVLGLVTLDVASIEIAEGPGPGRHVEGPTRVRATAVDNEGGGIVRMDLRLDDRLIASSCGGALSYVFDADRLDAGPHRLELAATTASGRVGTRRSELYSGAFYITGLGTRFDDRGTTFSWRNLTSGGEVLLDVSTERGDRVWRRRAGGAEGAMHFTWDGRDGAGEARGRGRYVATLAYLREGRVVQTESLPFVHDTSEVQDRAYAQVNGSVSSGAGGTAGALVELVDEQGRVVQQTRSTRSGEYRFRNVREGNYRVRVQRSGFTRAEAPVQAAAAATSQADMNVQAQ